MHEAQSYAIILDVDTPWGLNYRLPVGRSMRVRSGFACMPDEMAGARNSVPVSKRGAPW